MDSRVRGNDGLAFGSLAYILRKSSPQEIFSNAD